jgi:D-3-phosphoglycerate dehydrogenase / 2-oxoglutarate reductase
VFDSEPPDPAAIEGVDNLVARLHSAFYSEESVQESQRKAAEAIADVLQSRAL